MYHIVSEADLLKLTLAIGRMMSSSKDVFLVPHFTGTDYLNLYESIRESRYKAVNLEFLLVEQEEVNSLFDQLSSDSNSLLKNWRINSEFRQLLDKFQGYMRGIEDFVYEHSRVGNTRSMALQDSYSFSKMNIVMNLPPNLPYEDLIRRILLQISLDRGNKLSSGNLTFKELENIGLISLVDSGEYDGKVRVQIPYIFL